MTWILYIGISLSQNQDAIKHVVEEIISIINTRIEISEHRNKLNDIIVEVHDLDTKYANITQILEYSKAEWKQSTIAFLLFSMFSGKKRRSRYS